MKPKYKMIKRIKNLRTGKHNNWQIDKRLLNLRTGKQKNWQKFVNTKLKNGQKE